MKKQWLTVIERAIHSEQDLFPLNQTWAEIHHDYNVGRPKGNKLELLPQDKSELVMLVKQKHGLDLNRQAVADLAGLHREQALSIGAIDEKLAGQAVKKHRMAIRALPGCALKINRQHYQLPDAGYLDTALDAITETGHNCVLVIENYRCFDVLGKMSLNLEPPFDDPLVVFRGDAVYSEKTVRQLITQLALPTLAMLDLDPKGLSIAQSLPHIAGLLAPGLSELERMLKDPNKANSELYTKQLAGCRKALAESPHPLIVKIWEILQDNQAGIAQEHWLNGEVGVIVHRI